MPIIVGMLRVLFDPAGEIPAVGRGRLGGIEQKPD